MSPIIEKELCILAGGFGTRLSPVIGTLPKLLAPVSGEPFIKVALNEWYRSGFRRFNFLLGYKAQMVMEELAKINFQSFQDCKFNYIVEQSPLGTGGAIKNAVDTLAIDDYFFVVNSDTWIKCNFIEMLAQNTPSVAVTKIENANRFGLIKFDQNDKIIEFNEKVDEDSSGYINAGIYLFHKQLFNDFLTGSLSLEKDMLPKWASENKLSCFHLNSAFCDIGVPDSYYEFIREKEFFVNG